MRILLLSAYDAASHRNWRQGLVDSFSEYRWSVLSLPPRYFSWRIRGNPLDWWQQQSQVLQRDYDLLIATSMTDLATLRGLLPNLANVPAWLYCHENQFAFPQTSHVHSSIEAQMVFVYACLAAQHISFNSAYNRATAIQGMRELFRRLPEKRDSKIIEGIEARSSVLPVPLSMATVGAGVRRSVDQPLSLLWNHRWEYDKGPARLLAFARQLHTSGQPFRLYIVGQQFRQQPQEFEKLKVLLDASSTLELAHWGYIEKQWDYQQLMQQCDIVLSTAEHDFQGLSILEAVQQGCIPLVPDRLAYPEWFGEQYRYPIGDDVEQEARQVFARLQSWQKTGLPAVPDVSFLTWQSLREDYAVVMNKLCA